MKPQFQLVFSTLCQRISMGAFIMALVANYCLGMSVNINVTALSALIVLGVGMLGTMTHLGKPGRFLNSFANPHSHLTQEAIFAIIVCICFLVIGINNWLIAIPPALEAVLVVVAAVASLCFIWITAVTYKMRARPAWNTAATPINFILTFLSIGGMGAYVIAIATKTEVTLSFLIIIAVVTVAAIAGQLIYSNFVRHVGYRVDINPFSDEFKGLFIGWLVTGIVIPAILFIALFLMPQNLLVVTVLFLSEAISLFFWQSFYFMCGKEVWYFPQYEKDLALYF